jgi:hypothetical protein
VTGQWGGRFKGVMVRVVAAMSTEKEQVMEAMVQVA